MATATPTTAVRMTITRLRKLSIFCLFHAKTDPKMKRRPLSSEALTAQASALAIVSTLAVISRVIAWSSFHIVDDVL